MDVTLIDHLLVWTFALVVPLYGSLINYPRHLAALRKGRPDQRVRIYRGSLRTQWGLTAIAVAVWLGYGRSLDALGFRMPGGIGFFIGLAVALAIIVFLGAQLRAVRASGDLRAHVRERFEREVPFMPRTNRELGWFSAVAVTAGICEEILFRGYLFVYLAHYVGVPGAVGVSAVLFGLGHLYQGGRGALRIGIVGLVAAGLLVLTGSLWIPIVLHAFVDLNAGMLARASADDDEPPDTTVG